MMINGTRYTFVRSTGGWDILANGREVGWSAGTLADAKMTAKDIARSTAARS